MSSLEANLVSLLIEPSQERIAAAFASNLRQSGVVVKSVVLASDRDMTQKLTDSRMIISLLRREAVERAFLYQVRFVCCLFLSI